MSLLDKTLQWLESVRNLHVFHVHPIEFSQLNSWSFEEKTGNLVHSSGRFFRVLGLRQTIEWEGTTYTSEQPAIEQPEVGILGFMTRQKNGERQFLIQAKFEPGTLNGLQLAPTLQATHSNYSQVHQGQKPPYLDYFLNLEKSQILFDCLQSEHGCRFYQKMNRNLIIEVNEDVEVRPEFRWVSFDEIRELVRTPNLLNMPARSVLAATLQAEGDSNSTTDLRSWIEQQRRKIPQSVEVVGLKDLEDWVLTPTRFAPRPGSSPAQVPSLSIGAVSIEAKLREIAKWTQPLLWCDRDAWISGLLIQKRDGVLYCLVQNFFEPGLRNNSELGPTLSYRQPEMKHRSQKIEFESLFKDPKSAKIRYDSVQSSEGGRFYHEQNRLMIVEVEQNQQLELPQTYRWVPISHLRSLLNEPGWINIELREIMACLI